MKRYNNYHKHDHISSIITPDSNAKMIDYIKRAIELGEPNVFTTNHGTGGDIFEAKTLCNANNLHCKFGLEGYIVPNPLEKDARNFHIMLLPRTNIARKKLNLANSRAHGEGFYYKPRLFLTDLLENFDDDELYITSACVAGLCRDEDSIKQLLLPLYEKFGKSLFLEVQAHNENVQKDLNQRILQLSEELGLNMIAANDSHYIYPHQYTERLELLKGKGINYADEDSFILDYPDYETLCKRFKQQGVLNNSQIIDAIDQTLVFDECEDLELSDDIKMPTIYPGLNDGEKVGLLKDILNKKYKQMLKIDNVTAERKKIYKEEVLKEMQVIEDTQPVHSVDYFLLNDKIMDLAINKYGGILTRSGRGSCGAFLINKVLGITQIDRLTTSLPLYSERFMSTARLLENRAMPDIDYNIVSQEPFVKASKELFGEHGCYPMLAYGTMKENEAFRNVCRSHELVYDEYNAVAMNMDQYRDDDFWGQYINEAGLYTGTIISKSPHPCAFVLSNKDIREEIGLVRVGDVLCAMITSDEADQWKYLKNDYLVVTVWLLISEVCKAIGIEIPTVKQLTEMLDDKVWNLFADGITATLNQVDGEWATSLVKKFKPKSIEELAMFVACIRPSFDSFRDDFINRRPYTTGSKDLDKLLKSTHNYVLFQENLMQYFEWLGVTPAESIGLIKKISKKKIKPTDFENLTQRIRTQWIANTGSIDGFEETWADMQSMMSYGFNSPHGLAYALDCLYCAYLKAHYPLEYYATVLNIYEKSKESTNKLVKELEYFDIKLSSIKFRYSQPEYTYNRETNTIYKGMSAIKYLNKKMSREINKLYDRQYDNFIALLVDLKQTSVDTRQLDILIKLDFFSEFGEINTLLRQRDIFDMLYGRKTLKIAEVEALGLSKEHIEQLGGKVTAKQVKDLDTLKLIEILCDYQTYPKTTVVDKINYEQECLGYLSIKMPNLKPHYAYVLSVEGQKNKFVKLYRLKTGEVEMFKVKEPAFNANPIAEQMIIKTIEAGEEKKWRKTPDGQWTRTDETEMILYRWNEVKC